MIGSGVYIEKDNEGNEVGFHFGTLASMYTEEVSGKPIYAVFKDIEKMSITALVQYFYGGLTAYNFLNGVAKKISLSDAAVTLDKFEVGKLFEIYSQSIKSPIKNGKAPVTTGQQVEG